MGELYNPYPKLPKNIRQIGERDQIVKLYVEDYVNTYLKRLYPTGGRDLRVGLLLGEIRSQDGIPYVFADGALEMEDVTQDGEKVVFTEDAWKRAYQTMEQMFPRRAVLGWFLCGAPGSSLSPLNYWKQHGQYFSGKHELMYLNSGLEGEEAIYIASEDGFYKMRGYYIYYERNQMMQDYMVSRKDAHRVETGTRETVIQDFRQRLEEKKVEAFHRRTTVSRLGTACGVLSVLVMASGVVMFNNYQKMKAMESVIASVVPANEEVEIEELPGEIYPTLAEIVIGENDAAEAASGSLPENAGNGGGGQLGAAGIQSGNTGQVGTAGMQLESVGQLGSAGTQNGAAGQSETTGVSGAQPGNAGQAVTVGNQSGHVEQSGSSSSAPAAQVVQVPADAIRHMVKPGETLYGICMEHYSSMANMDVICQWNGLGDGSHIAAGQEILIPPVE